MLDPADLAKLARPSMEDGKSEAAWKRVPGMKIRARRNGNPRVHRPLRGVTYILAWFAWCVSDAVRSNRDVRVRRYRCGCDCDCEASSNLQVLVVPLFLKSFSEVHVKSDHFLRNMDNFHRGPGVRAR